MNEQSLSIVGSPSETISISRKSAEILLKWYFEVKGVPYDSTVQNELRNALTK